MKALSFCFSAYSIVDIDIYMLSVFFIQPFFIVKNEMHAIFFSTISILEL